MAFFEGWPYTNFHDCNLDWVMETTRKVHVEVHQLHQELHRAINCEEQQRIDADVKLGERIDKEITDRTTADNALGARIDKEITDRTAADQQLQENINQEITDRQEAVSTEAAARQSADQQLQTAIDKEISDRTQAVTAEAEARAAADTALGQRIDAESADRTQAVNAEATARQQADAALGARIDKEITDRTAKDSELETAIANEATTRANAITDLRDDLTHEINDREAGDDALGARIDGIAPQLLPAGGTQGQVLGKATGDNYAVAWQDPATAVNGLPEGGTVGQVLAKRGPDNFDTEWIDAPKGDGGTGEDPNAIRKDGTTVTTAAIPFAKGIQTPSITGTGMEGVALEANLDLNNHAISSLLPGTDEFDAVTVGQLNDKFANVHSIPVGGTAGQVLGKIDGTDYNVTWVDQTGGGGEGGNVPAGGTTGQVLAKSTDADYQTEWVNQTGGLPEGGTVGQVVTKTADGAEWADAHVPSNVVTLDGGKQIITDPQNWELTTSRESGAGIKLGSDLTLYNNANPAYTPNIKITQNNIRLMHSETGDGTSRIDIGNGFITLGAADDKSAVSLGKYTSGKSYVILTADTLDVELYGQTPEIGQVLTVQSVNAINVNRKRATLAWGNLGTYTEIPTGVEGLNLWVNKLTRTAFWEYKSTISSVNWVNSGIFASNISYYSADKLIYINTVPAEYRPLTGSTISLGFRQTHAGFGEGNPSMVDRIVTIRSNALRIEYTLLFNGSAPNPNINDSIEFTMVTRF